MNAFFHRNYAAELESTNFDAASKPDSTGGSVRSGRTGGTRLLIVAAALLALLFGLLAEPLPAQAQSADPPSSPRQLIAEPEDGGMALSWTVPAYIGDSSILYYEMRHAEGTSIPSDTDWTSVGNSTSSTVGQLTNGTLYTFEVRAVNSQGHGAAAAVEGIANIPSTISVIPVQATVTEGADAVFRFSRVGRTAESLTLGFNVSGHLHVMSAATRALVHDGPGPDTTITFAAGETEKIVALSTEQDREIEADGEIWVNPETSLEYAVGDPYRVKVLVQDDDAASTAVALSVVPETVDEDAGATTVEVTGALDDAVRTSDTEVSVSVSAGTASAGDFTAVPGFTLTIPAGETEGTASFSLAPVNDAIDEDAETVSVGGTVQGLTVTAATVTIADDDTAGVDVSASSLTVPEGDNRTYTVALLSQPTGPVTVTPSVAGDPDVTVRPTALTFTASTWSQAQTVTVSAAQDGDAADDAATVSHAVSGGGYDAVAADDVAVAVQDDDAALQAPVLTVAWPGFEQVRLVWTAPPGGGTSITGYEVHVERVDDGSVVHDWAPAGAALEHTVTGLENEVEYRFRVRAVNQSGPGAPSNPLTATPVSLILTIVPHDDVDTIVEGEYARFDIVFSSPLAHWIELDVRYTYTGEMMLNPVSRDTTQYGPRTQASILPRVVATLDDSVIEPDGSVTLSLLPGDGYGIGELSSATIRVLDNDGGRAPAAPAAPTVSALSPTVIEATWSAPSDRGNPGSIESYDVQYRKVGEADWLDGPVGVTGTRALLEGLEAATSYEVRVLARNMRNPRTPDRVNAEYWSAPGAGSTRVPSAVTVSVAEPAGSPQVSEGDVLAFIVTADPAPASNLRVEVVVSESGPCSRRPCRRRSSSRRGRARRCSRWRR